MLAVGLTICGVAAAEVAQPVVEEVVVRAHPLSAEGIAQPVQVLADAELSRALAASLGTTLAHLPGIHSASFGDVVGRPLIRGLGGARVKVTEDRIDSLDVSVSSPDHLTTIEPFIASSIEVLKGPSTLLYGTGAIGGVVDVHTGRIPHERQESVSLRTDLRAADNADRRSAATRLDGGVGSFAFHVDGFYREADEYDIPGFSESAALRREEAEEGGEEEDGEEEVRGRLPGSQFQVQGGAGGLSYIGDQGFIGLSVSRYEGEYGLPGAHGHHEEHSDEPGVEEEEEEGSPLLDLKQTRIDFEAGWNAPVAWLESLNLRVGSNDYEHTEVEGNGEVGTRFQTDAVEARVEAVHEPLADVRGAFGLQWSDREFSAIGEEAFVLPVETETRGIFYVAQRQFAQFELEGGLRLEQVRHDPQAGRAREFDLEALSLGLVKRFGTNWTVKAQLDHSTRAPVAEELYSDGAHLATGSFELGDDSLDEESARNLSVTLRYDSERFGLALSGYQTRFDDFIYERNTGLERDELPLLQWQQDDARFTGMELEGNVQAAAWEGGALWLGAVFDMTRARLLEGSDRNLPRIPPRRWRLEAIVDWQRFRGSISYGQTAAQRDVAFGERETARFEDLNLHLGYGFSIGNAALELFVAGRNLTDDEQRFHTSFIKDVAPQPGRSIEAGIILNL